MGSAQTHSFQLQIPAPRHLTSREQLGLYRSALKKNPDSLELRYSLASQLLYANEFEELLGLLALWQNREFRFVDIHTEALLSQESEPANLEARSLCLEVLEKNLSPAERAAALGTLAKVHHRLASFEAARLCLSEALALNVEDKNAYKRAVALDLRQHQPESVLNRAGVMIAEGVAHSRVLCSQTLALATLGKIEEAREAQGLAAFLARPQPQPPQGWDTLDAFNQALAEEIHHHPDIRYNRYGSASAHTWRIDQPALQRSRLFPLLQQMIAREVEAYVDRLPDRGHPFVENRPEAAILRNWCVITEGDGHETWHVHQNGWLSGVYYIHVQDHIANGTGNEGCIAFGLPEDIVGEVNAQAFGEVLCRPHTGLMMIFPSHVYHRTYPHHGAGRRICYAFDILPMGRAD